MSEVVEVTTGNVKNRYVYDAFGATTLSSPSPPSVENPFGFTGREWEKDWILGTPGPAKSLYYYRARYYNPAIGRFLSEDPIGFGGGANLYSYVGNGPLAAIDPMGLYRIAGNYADRVRTAVNLIREKLQNDSSGCGCLEYFDNNAPPYQDPLALLEKERPDSFPIIVVTEIKDPRVRGSMSFPYYIFLDEERVGQGTPCDIASLILHELGHQSRADTTDNEDQIFFRLCKLGCIRPRAD